MNPGNLASRDRKIARLGGAGAQHDRRKILEKPFGGQILSDVHTGFERDAFRLHQPDPPFDHLALVEFHVGNPVEEKPADPVSALEDGHLVPGLVQLVGASQARRPGADDGHILARAEFRRIRGDPAFLPAPVNNRALDGLDRDRRLDDSERAGSLAWCRADATGELGEVVGFVEPVERLAPEAAIDEVIPLGDQVVDRAAAGHPADELAGVAEWNAAVHAAGSLGAEFVLRHVDVKLVPVGDAVERRHVGRELAKVFDESGGFSHN